MHNLTSFKTHRDAALEAMPSQCYVFWKSITWSNSFLCCTKKIDSIIVCSHHTLFKILKMELQVVLNDSWLMTVVTNIHCRLSLWVNVGTYYLVVFMEFESSPWKWKPHLMNDLWNKEDKIYNSSCSMWYVTTSNCSVSTIVTVHPQLCIN